MAICILILGAFILLYLNVYGWIQDWGGSMSISVYLAEDVDKNELEKIEQFLKDQPNVLSYRFVSKEEALRQFKQALGPQSKLLSALASNPLPASFEVQLKSANNKSNSLKALAMRLGKLTGVQEVQYSEAWITRFKDILEVVKIIGFIVGGLLALGALFIVTNTIKLTIYSRKEEIEILKLVGATDWFVKAPFIIEGMIQGVVSAVAALGVLHLGFLVFSMKKTAVLTLAVARLQFIPLAIIGGIIGLSLVVGAIGSFIAVGRFFEVAGS